jgi:exosome complex component CSL4
LTGRRVEPGDELAVIEEFVPGPGTYVDDGVIRASIAGTVVFNDSSKVVEVRPYKHLRTPRRCTSALGVVTGVRHDLVTVSLVAEVSTKPQPRLIGEYSGVFDGAVPIQLVAEEFVRDLYDYYRVGDVVIAKIVSGSNPFTLSTKNPQHGVVYGLCSKCGGILVPESNKTVKCESCGNREPRKASIIPASKIPLARLKYSIWRK